MHSYHFNINRLHNHRRLMNWFVIAALIVLFAGLSVVRAYREAGSA